MMLLYYPRGRYGSARKINTVPWRARPRLTERWSMRRLTTGGHTSKRPSSRPRYGDALFVRLPRKLNHFQSVPRNLWLDCDFGFAPDGIYDILIVAPVRPWNTGVPPNIETSSFVEFLMVCIKFFCSGKRAPDPLILHPESGIQRRFSRGCNSFGFLWVRSELSCGACHQYD